MILIAFSLLSMLLSVMALIRFGRASRGRWKASNLLWAFTSIALAALSQGFAYFVSAGA